VDLPEPEPPPAGERPEPPRILTVARVDDEHKGHRALLELLPRVREHVPGVRWSVVGDGRLLPDLRRRAAELGVADAVEFLGRVRDGQRDELLRRAHAFVMLTHAPPSGAGEGFGIVFVEAAAHGLPVVAGRAPGVVDALRHGRTGELVDPRDAAATTEAIVRVLRGGPDVERITAEGRAWAEDLAWPRTAARYREVIGAAVTHPRRAQAARRVGWAVDLARRVPEI
jgi:phosphatidyl-myo-inositol dimannoside synthase